MLLPSGEPFKSADYKISNGSDELTAIADNKGRSKRINSLQEESLKLDLNWMKLDIEPNEGDE
jgi:type VI secretion system secreted protein VgrG